MLLYFYKIKGSSSYKVSAGEIGLLFLLEFSFLPLKFDLSNTLPRFLTYPQAHTLISIEILATVQAGLHLHGIISPKGTIFTLSLKNSSNKPTINFKTLPPNMSHTCAMSHKQNLDPMLNRATQLKCQHNNF